MQTLVFSFYKVQTMKTSNKWLFEIVPTPVRKINPYRKNYPNSVWGKEWELQESSSTWHCGSQNCPTHNSPEHECRNWKMASISASVGLKGINKPNDVRIIQGALNRLAAACGGPETKLATDGMATKQLFSIIHGFQARFFGTLNPDAKVDVGGNTYKALARQLKVKRIAVYLSAQQLEVVENGCSNGSFPCVTGDYEFPTERGEFRVLSKQHPYRSKKYDVQMNYAMFFTSDGKAIHQYHGLSPLWLVRWMKQDLTDWFGSHGCVRLEEQDAKALYEWVAVGTRVTVY